MIVRRLVMIFYVFLTGYLALNATTLSFGMVLPAVLLMWICFVVFWRASGQVKSRDNSSGYFLHNSPYWLSGMRKAFVGIMCVGFSLLVVRFYTGQTVGDVFLSLGRGESLYWQYQQYFVENNLRVMSLRKIPFIFMLFFVKCFLIYGFVSLVALKKSTTLSDKVFLMVASMSYLYISVARGTSFEIFETLFLILYSLSQRKTLVGTPGSSNARVIVGTTVVGIIGLFTFSYIFGLRGVHRLFVTREIRYDPTAFLSIVLPSLAYLSVTLAGYFGFGFLFTSVVMRKIWLKTFTHFLAGILPFGFDLIGVDSFGQEVCGTYIDCGASWQPDVADLFQSLGLLGLLLACFLLGRLLRYMNSKRFGDYRVVRNMTNFMIMLQMLSLPIGNFIVVSSANRLIVSLLVFLSARYLILQREIRLHDTR